MPGAPQSRAAARARAAARGAARPVHGPAGSRTPGSGPRPAGNGGGTGRGGRLRANLAPAWPWAAVAWAPSAVVWLDLLGTYCFSLTGTRVAVEHGLDAYGATFVGAVAAMGGGTMRCLLLGAGAFWMEQPAYVLFSLAASAYTFLVWPRQVDQAAAWEPWLEAADDFSLSVFAVIGASAGYAATQSLVSTFPATLITCTVGGIMRDLLVRRPVRVLNTQADNYIATALFGAAAFLASLPLLPHTGVGYFVNMLLLMLLTFAFKTTYKMLGWGHWISDVTVRLVGGRGLDPGF